MASFFRAYNTILIRRPLLASCGTAAILFGGGDVIAQQAIERKGKNHDFARTARLTFYGGVIFSLCMTKWYQFLNSIKFASPTKAIVARVCLDQVVLTPVAVPFFFGSMSILEGKPHEAVERIQANYFPTLIRNWGVFLPTQIINFAIVPHHLRFVFVSVVSLFWNTYLSAVNARQDKLESSAEHTVENLREH
ncbi:Protein SYM1 [Termitomyces sp. T112]|nr:Protein SYM1 [Termitomyces sp. T112]